MSCRQKRDSAVWHAFGARILVCVFGGHLCFIQSNLWLRSLQGAPQITEFTVMGYSPLLLSDKISSSYLLPLLALRLLMPQSVCLLSCIRQVQQGHRLHRCSCHKQVLPPNTTCLCYTHSMSAQALHSYGTNWSRLEVRHFSRVVVSCIRSLVQLIEQLH